MYNTNWYIDKKGGGVKPPPPIDDDDVVVSGNNVKGLHKKNVLSLPQVEMSNNLLQQDITRIESLINNNTDQNELMLHTSSTCEYKQIHPSNNKNKPFRNRNNTSYHDKLLMFRRVHSDDKDDNHKMHTKVVTDNVFLSSKGMKREIRVPHVKIRPTKLKKEIKNSYNRCNTFLNLNSLKNKHKKRALPLKTSSNGVLKKTAEKIIIKSPTKPTNDVLSEKELLYNRLSRNNLSETEDSLIQFLEKTQKVSYEKAK